MNCRCLKNVYNNITENRNIHYKYTLCSYENLSIRNTNQIILHTAILCILNCTYRSKYLSTGVQHARNMNT